MVRGQGALRLLPWLTDGQTAVILIEGDKVERGDSRHVAGLLPGETGVMGCAVWPNTEADAGVLRERVATREAPLVQDPFTMVDACA